MLIRVFVLTSHNSDTQQGILEQQHAISGTLIMYFIQLFLIGCDICLILSCHIAM